MVVVNKNLKNAGLKLPSGNYDFRAIAIDDGHVEVDNAMWITLEVINHKTLAGRSILKVLSLSANPVAEGFLKEYLDAFGIDTSSDEFDTDDLIGKEINLDYTVIDGEKYPVVDNPQKVKKVTSKK
jgi:hypothetical protein